MILVPRFVAGAGLGKPRASGDDPGSEAQYKERGA